METVLFAKHLLILCCFGGTPHIDLDFYEKSKAIHKATDVLDPTDWIAVDTSGTLFIFPIFRTVAG